MPVLCWLDGAGLKGENPLVSYAMRRGLHDQVAQLLTAVVNTRQESSFLYSTSFKYSDKETALRASSKLSSTVLRGAGFSERS